MTHANRRPAPRSAALGLPVLLLALAVSAMACGGTDDTGGNASQNAARTATAGGGSDPMRTGSDREQIVATLSYVRDAFNAGDGDAFCSKLSPAGTSQYERAMRAVGQRGRCAHIATSLAKFAKRARRPQKAVTVSSVTIRGARAVTKSKGGLAGNSGDTFILVKDHGVWKLSDIGLGKLAESAP